jgi:dGTPase
VSSNKQKVFHGENSISAEERLDWEKFEGNAQSFRICSRNDNLDSMGYVRMTFASLGTLVKYPWPSNHQRASGGKYNVFQSEVETFEIVWHALGLTPLDGAVCRHPMSYLMEAADDICYGIIDIEDAVTLGITPMQTAVEILSEAANCMPTGMSLGELRGRAIGKQIESFWHAFMNSYDDIMIRNGPKDLKSVLSPTMQSTHQKIKSNYNTIFSHRNKVAVELGAYKVFGKIIKAICGSVHHLAETRNFDEISYPEKRCLELTWGENLARENVDKPFIWWLRQSRDFVAGLTDNYARQLGREIEGI